MNRIRRLPIVAAVAVMALFGIATATATTATAANGPCQNTQLTGTQQSQFDRCTSTSSTGNWAGLDCIENVNVNGANGPFNVYAIDNFCPFRVWLHQDAWNGTNWGNGWTYCISDDTPYDIIPSQFVHPLNIYLSANASPC